MRELAVGSHSFRRIVLSVAILHCILIAVFWLKIKTQETQLKHAPKAIVSLGFRSASAGTTASNQVRPKRAIKAIEKTEPIKQQKIEPIKKEKVNKKNDLVAKAVNKPKPKPTLKKSKSKPTLKKPIEPIKPAEKKIKPERQPIEKKIEAPEKKQTVKTSTPKVKQKRQIEGASGIDGSLDNKIKRHESGQSNQLSGDPDSARYDMALRQHLMKFKRYPRSLKLKRKEGAVEVVFSINKKGKLLKTKILKRIGDKVFDRTIRRLFEQAKPFPLPPIDANWKTREYRLTFTYKLD